MNNKILSAVLITGIATTGFAGLSSADESTNDNSEKTFKEFRGFGWDKPEMTEEQKSEKEARMAEREAKNAVIDALLAGEALTDEQETLRAKIIVDRAERKAEFLEKKAKKEEMKAIFEKKKAGEDLTEEEQTLLDEMKDNRKGGKKGRGKHHRR